MGGTQKIVVLCVVVVVLTAAFVWYQQYRVVPPSPVSTDAEPATSVESNAEAVSAFKFALEEEVRMHIGQPIEGYEPAMFMQVYPGLESVDFDGVDAAIGRYEYVNGELVHNLEGETLIHSAAGAISDEGIETLLANVTERLAVNMSTDSVAFVLAELSEVSEPVPVPTPTPAPPESESESEPVPVPDQQSIVCTDEMKSAEMCTMEYAPVCGLVQVQCITAPCPPIPETFSNGCSACAQGNVISYTNGACEAY